MNLNSQIITGLTISKSMQLYIPVFFNNILSDSIQYHNPPRKALKYPLKIGSRWLELEYPFYRERFVNEKENIEVSAGTFSCYKVESEWNLDLIFTDYINLTDGLIKRIVFADSAGITAPGDPDPVSYARITSLSELAGKNF